MLKGILALPLFLYRTISSWIDMFYNFLVLRHRKVSYGSFPIIKGRIQLQGEGHFIFGKGLKFNCSSRSNFVGLYKTCTIAVLKDAALEIGDNSGFSGISIYCSKNIRIGKYVNCGGNVSIWDTDFHPLDFTERRIHNVNKIGSSPITIGDDVFIGANSIILKGVLVGDRAVIGAGSVVTKSIPSDEIWAGNPAKFIRKNL